MPDKKIIFVFLKYGIFLFLLLNAANCNNTKKKYIIPDDKFVDVLVDIHLADAIALQNNPVYSGFELDSADLYESVFSNHGVTHAQFDSTMSYYGTHPDDFQLIYNKVISKLNVLTETMLNSPSETEPQTQIPELIWKSATTYSLPEMGNVDRLEINVPVQSTGEYTIEARIKLFKDDESENPRITVYYWYDNNTVTGYRDSFPEIELRKDGNENSYLTSKITTDSLVTHIKGWILNHSNPDTLFQKHAQVSEIKVTYMP